MAVSDKNLLIVPNISSTTDDPKIVFSGADADTAAQNITLKVYPTNNGTLSFEGSAGQLFSITNNLSGTIFSVNDISGIPSIEVLDTGLIKLAQYSGSVSIGLSNVYTSTYTTSGTSQVTIDTFATASYRTVKYIAQMTSGSAYHSIELFATHDGTTVYLSQYGEIKSGSSLGTFDASIANGTFSLLFTAANAVTTVKFSRTLIAV